MDWEAVFDESYPEPGASEDGLRRLVADIGLPLPAEYLALLRWSDGGEFRTGKRWFQFFPAVDPIHGVLAMREGYELPRYMPGALPIAFNGGGTFYVFDVRQPMIGGEYPVCCTRAGNLGWAPDECVRISNTFLEACQGRTNVDSLLS